MIFHSYVTNYQKVPHFRCFNRDGFRDFNPSIRGDNVAACRPDVALGAEVVVPDLAGVETAGEMDWLVVPK